MFLVALKRAGWVDWLSADEKLSLGGLLGLLGQKNSLDVGKTVQLVRQVQSSTN